MDLSITQIQLQMISLRGDVMNTLTGHSAAGGNTASFADTLGACCQAGRGAGRNPALRDPESAFRMMSHINRLENLFKAQHVELSELGESVDQLAAVGEQLGAAVDASSSDEQIVSQLQGFIDRYNAWEDHFDDKVADGAVLDRIQAAEISLYELEQSIKSLFNGANDGVSGLADLGVEIDPVSHQAGLDGDRLSAMLQENRNGVVSAIDEFSANFARSAELLNEDDNFIPRAIDNRGRALDYIAGNRSGLEREFGSGDAATAGSDIARAVAAYNSAHSIG